MQKDVLDVDVVRSSNHTITADRIGQAMLTNIVAILTQTAVSVIMDACVNAITAITIYEVCFSNRLQTGIVISNPGLDQSSCSLEWLVFSQNGNHSMGQLL